MADAIPDYQKTHFETSNLPICCREPTFDVILAWYNALKANAAKVKTNLFEGQHGYLALLVSPALYALISAGGNTLLAHPGLLIVPARTAINLTMNMQDAHKEALQVFWEYQGVEAAFQQMIVEAIDPIHLEALQDANTSSIDWSIHNIIQYLYDTYSDISL